MDANEKNYKKNWLKLSLALVLCLLARLLPLRAPNVEPILATVMPIGRAYGVFVGFSFAILSILLYDVVTGTLGIQTFFTAGAYGLLGLWSARYFKKIKGSRMDYVRFAVIGTILYDALTGFTVGPIFYHQPLLGSIAGQIPFTALHLLGNTAFAFFLSPLIYSFLIRERKNEKMIPIITLAPKTI